MPQPSTAEIVRRYVAVWNEPDPAARRAAIAGLWAPDGAEFVEGTQFRGQQELEARVAHAHTEFVASGRYTATAATATATATADAAADDPARHDDIVTLTIQLTAPGGEVAWAARVFLLLDTDGRIREDYQLTTKPLAA